MEVFETRGQNNRLSLGCETGKLRMRIGYQQMQWTQRGAHFMLQTRTKILNNELEEMFRRWYPRFPAQAA